MIRGACFALRTESFGAESRSDAPTVTIGIVMIDLLILGGGVIGLSLAFEAARANMRVVVLERGQSGQEASWAGAGILPATPRDQALSPLERLSHLSHELHRTWSQELRERTGIDTGYLRCGGVYLSPPVGAEGQTSTKGPCADAHAAGRESAEPVAIDAHQLRSIEPYLRSFAPSESRPIVFSPDDGQLRNPRHVKALIAACRALGVTIEEGEGAEEIVHSHGRIEGVRTTRRTILAGAVCAATGAWTRELLARIGRPVAIRPIRGQIALLNLGAPTLKRIVNVGKRYIVPRADGRVLIGSTEEDAGFDKRTTASGIAELLNFGVGLVPSLAGASLERCWSGLRPGTADERPYMGEVPGVRGLFVAAGHFRSGLGLSPGVARVMCAAIRGETPEIDLSDFRVDRE